MILEMAIQEIKVKRVMTTLKVLTILKILTVSSEKL